MPENPTSGWLGKTMIELVRRNPHSVVTVVIAIAAVLSRVFYPTDWALLDDATLLLWPQFLMSTAFVALWTAIWVKSVKRAPIHPLVAFVTLALTIAPLLNDFQYWACVVGKCLW